MLIEIIATSRINAKIIEIEKIIIIINLIINIIIMKTIMILLNTRLI